MGYAKPLKKTICLLCALMLALGYGGIDVSRAFGEALAPESQPAPIVEDKNPADNKPEKPAVDGELTAPAIPDNAESAAGNDEPAAPAEEPPVAAPTAPSLDEPSPADAAEDIPIDETHFPDAAFRAIVQEIVGDEVLTQAVVDATTELDVANRGITSLKGIEYFTALVKLDCSYNHLTSLDLSKNVNLEGANPDGQIISIKDAGNSIDLQAIDPDVDPTRIPSSHLDGAAIDGAVLSDYTVGTMLSYDYDTGMNMGSGNLHMFVILEPMGASDLAITTGEARPVPADEFKVTENGTLVVKGSGTYIVRMASYVDESEDRIGIATDASPTITLDSLNLRSTQGSSIEIKPGAGDVTLYVQDFALLNPQNQGAGILKNNEATLTIAAHPNFPGESRLEATGCGGTYPGIGASGVGGLGKVTACKNIVIENLNVTAEGSKYAAGIGGGLGITEVSGIALDGCTAYVKGGIGAAGIGGGKADGITVSDIEIKDSDVQATTDSYGAGIGSGQCDKGPIEVSDISISNSVVTAKGKNMNAGIGAGSCGEESIAVTGITIERSQVEAEGDNASAGIGSGWAKGDNLVSQITIIGRSEVEAFGGLGAPGIGSSYTDTGDSTLDGVHIQDSYVRAEGGKSADGSAPISTAYGEDVAPPTNIIGAGAGIGSGFSDKGDSTAKNVVVSGLSWVYAAAGNDADGGGASAGIGSGPAWGGTSQASGIVVQGGQVFAQGGTTTASDMGPDLLPGIGAGSGKTRAALGNAIEPDEGAWSRVWEADTEDEINESYDDPFVDYARERTSLDDERKRYMAIAVWQDEMLSCSGSDDGYRYEKGLLVIEGDGSYTVTMTPESEYDPELLDDEAEAFGGDGAAPRLVNLFSPTPLGIVVDKGASPTVVLDGVSINVADIDGADAFAIEDGAGDTTVLLAGENALASGNGRAGIQKGDGDGKLTVSSASGNGSTDGSLEVLGGDGAAGIGGGKAETGSSDATNIEIAGGTVSAVAGHVSHGRSAAGIGGGSTTDTSGNADARNIVVSGGNVSAQGSSSNYGAGAGIGGGTPGSKSHANVSDILISGGTVKAVGGNNGGAGIGSGATLGVAESVACRIAVNGGNVEATGGNNAAGIGSGFAQGDGNESRAEGISVSGGTIKATAGSIGGAAGIGSGQTKGGPSIARDIAVSGGTVEAVGATGDFGGGTFYAIMGGAGIGSGCSSPYGPDSTAAESRAEDIVVSGGTVKATGGSNSPGIGSGTTATDFVFLGSSTATNIQLTGGTVTAVGGLTHANSSRDPIEPGQIDSEELIGDLVQLPAIGAGLAITRTFENAEITPDATLIANAWKGATAEDAVQFVENATETTSIADVQDAYLRAEFSARPGTEPEQPIKPLPSADTPTGDKTGITGKPLVPTGDGLVPWIYLVEGILAITAAGLAAYVVVALARKRHGRR